MRTIKIIIFGTFCVVTAAIMSLPLAMVIGVLAGAAAFSDFWGGVFAGIRQFARQKEADQIEQNQNTPEKSVWERHIERLDREKGNTKSEE